MAVASYEGEEELKQELAALAKRRLSASRIASITKIALKQVKFFKHVVFHIERFAKVCAPESKLSALYVIDSILQASKAKLPDNVYAERFAKNILDTFWNIFEAPQEEHEAIKRVVVLWHRNRIFDMQDLSQICAVCTSASGSAPVLEPLEPLSSPSLSAAASLPPYSPISTPTSADSHGADERATTAPAHYPMPYADPTQPPPPAAAAAYQHTAYAHHYEQAPAAYSHYPPSATTTTSAAPRDPRSSFSASSHSTLPPSNNTSGGTPSNGGAAGAPADYDYDYDYDSSHYHQQDHPSYSSAGPYSDSNYPQHRPPPPPSSSSAPSYPSGSSSQDYAFSGAQYSQPSSSSSSSSYYSGGAAYNKDPYYNTEHHGGSASTGSASRAEDMNQTTPSTTLWVGSLAPEVTQDHLVQECRRYGAVERIFMCNKNPTAVMAFVTFYERRAAETAKLAMDGKRFLGSRFKIGWAPSPYQSPKGFDRATGYGYRLSARDKGVPKGTLIDPPPPARRGSGSAGGSGSYSVPFDETGGGGGGGSGSRSQYDYAYDRPYDVEHRKPYDSVSSSSRYADRRSSQSEDRDRDRDRDRYPSRGSSYGSDQPPFSSSGARASERDAAERYSDPYAYQHQRDSNHHHQHEQHYHQYQQQQPPPPPPPSSHVYESEARSADDGIGEDTRQASKDAASDFLAGLSASQDVMAAMQHPDLRGSQELSAPTGSSWNWQADERRDQRDQREPRDQRDRREQRDQREQWEQRDRPRESEWDRGRMADRNWDHRGSRRGDTREEQRGYMPSQQQQQQQLPPPSASAPPSYYDHQSSQSSAMDSASATTHERSYDSDRSSQMYDPFGSDRERERERERERDREYERYQRDIAAVAAQQTATPSSDPGPRGRKRRWDQPSSAAAQPSSLGGDGHSMSDSRKRERDWASSNAQSSSSSSASSSYDEPYSKRRSWGRGDSYRR